MLNKLHSLSRYKTNSGKNPKKKCLMHFDPDARVVVLNNWHKIQLCDKIFFSNLYLFDSIFSVIVWSNKLHDFDEVICFSDNCCYENG